MQLVLCAFIFYLCTLLLKDKTKKASKSATAELSDGDADSGFLSREELQLKLQKVTKEMKALERHQHHLTKR
jgi:hypothetical protein